MKFDLNQDSLVDSVDRRIWVEDLKWTYFGDSNLDGRFDTNDLVLVLQGGEYEDNIPGNSTWATGDWNGDGDFTVNDIVLALQAGGYETGPRVGSESDRGPGRIRSGADQLGRNPLRCRVVMAVPPTTSHPTAAKNHRRTDWQSVRCRVKRRFASVYVTGGAIRRNGGTPCQTSHPSYTCGYPSDERVPIRPT